MDLSLTELVLVQLNPPRSQEGDVTVNFTCHLTEPWGVKILTHYPGHICEGVFG